MKIKKKDLREWILFTLMLTFGIFLLTFTANVATAVPADWMVQANILSDLDPDQELTHRQIAQVQPVQEEIMTPPAWDMQALLTVEPEDNAQSTIVPVADFYQSPTPGLQLTSQIQTPEPDEQTSQGSGGFNSPTATAPVNPIYPTPTDSAAFPSYTASPTPPATPTTVVATMATNTPGPTVTSTLAQSQPTASVTPQPTNSRPTKEPKPTKDPGPGNGGGGGKGNKK